MGKIVHTEDMGPLVPQDIQKRMFPRPCMRIGNQLPSTISRSKAAHTLTSSSIKSAEFRCHPYFLQIKTAVCYRGEIENLASFVTKPSMPTTTKRYIHKYKRRHNIQIPSLPEGVHGHGVHFGKSVSTRWRKRFCPCTGKPVTAQEGLIHKYPDLQCPRQSGWYRDM